MDPTKRAEIVSLFKQMVPENEAAPTVAPRAVAVSETNIFGATIVVCGGGNVENVLNQIFGNSRPKTSD